MISILNNLQKQKNKLIITTLLIVIIVIALIIYNNNKHFSLEKKYYGVNKFSELEANKLEDLIKEKESFAIFIYQPLCINSYNFNKVITEFAYQYQMSFYKMEYSKIANTILENKIKYYPSFVIINKGVIVDYLDAESDNDLNAYNSLEGFKSWFSKYVVIKQVNKDSNNAEKPKTDQEIKINTVLKDVVYDKNKINIYFFWGDGCPHCEQLLKFFKSLELEFGKYFTLHSFEVWKNDENRKLLTEFANKKGEEVRGVPYIVISDKSFIGYKEEYENEILTIIKNEYKDSYDIYFDK